VSGHPYEQGFDLRLVPEKLLEPLLWSQPKFVFVNSMSDLFQDEVPEEYIVAVAEIMKLANWHTYQVLTKRSSRMRDLLLGRLREAAGEPHIWWGVSVEDRRSGIPRMEDLRRSSLAVAFLSIEPLLEDLGQISLDGIDWVIVGGESGPRARPMNRAWVESLQGQCRRGHVPFFFKQWGGVRKRRNGRLLNGRTYDEMPTRPPVAPPPADQRRRMIEALAPIVRLWRFEECLSERVSEARSKLQTPGANVLRLGR